MYFQITFSFQVNLKSKKQCKKSLPFRFQLYSNYRLMIVSYTKFNNNLISKLMGNICPSNCIYDCCTINAECTANLNNCYYYYYDWSWVYWTVGVTFTLLIIFTIIGIVCRRRRLQRAQQTLIIQTGPGSYQNSNYQNGQYGYQPGYNLNDTNRNMNQVQYQMGQPVFLSEGQYSSNQNYNNNQGFNGNNFQGNNQNQNISQGYVVQATQPVNAQNYNYKQA